MICYAAAAETLLTYDKGPGSTYRLATAYACVTETEETQRETTYNRFRSLYSIRSDIMHGRAHSVAAPNRLPHLTAFADMMRKLWRTVVSSPSLIAELEGTDAQRKAYLSQICAGYSPSR